MLDKKICKKCYCDEFIGMYVFLLGGSVVRKKSKKRKENPKSNFYYWFNRLWRRGKAECSIDYAETMPDIKGPPPKLCPYAKEHRNFTRRCRYAKQKSV